MKVKQTFGITYIAYELCDCINHVTEHLFVGIVASSSDDTLTVPRVWESIWKIWKFESLYFQSKIVLVLNFKRFFEVYIYHHILCRFCKTSTKIIKLWPKGAGKYLRVKVCDFNFFVIRKCALKLVKVTNLDFSTSVL